LSLPTVLFLGPASLCVLAWLGVGRAVPRRLIPGDLLLVTLTRIAVGAVAFTLLVFVLGRLGALHPAVLLALTGAAALPGVYAAREVFAARRMPRGLGRLGWTLFALLVAALALDVIASTAPPTSADALVYHVEFPRRWLELHRIDDPFWTYASFYPLGIETLFAQAMAVVGVGGAGSALAAGSTASALHGLLAVLAGLAVFGFARDVAGGSDVAGVLGAALFVLQGLVTWDSTSTFIDMGLVFYVVLAAWHAVRFARAPSRSTAAWVGLAAGGAAGAKYIGPLAALFVLLPVAIVALRRRALASLGLAAALVAVAGGGWYVKNAIVTGNPVYPLLFGGKLWDRWAEQWLHGTATATFPGTHTFPLRIFLLPVDLLLHGDRFDRGQYASTATLLLAPLALLVRRSRELAFVSLAVAGYLLIWWYAVPQARYLLPALGVLAAVAGAGLAPVLAAPGARRVAVVGVVSVGAAVWLASSIALTRQLVPVALGLEGRTHHVQRLTGTYDPLQAIQKRVGDARVGFAPSYTFLYWYPGDAIALDVPEFAYQHPTQLFRSRLRREGVEYAVFWGPVTQLPPLAGCARQVGTFPGRYVTSRSRGTSRPLLLSLYSLRDC
jgi:hypothetical protein